MTPPPPSTPVADSHPFVFPIADSAVLPNPSEFFAGHLLSGPLPTNSFFQNFAVENGDKPEYIHPYLIKSSKSSLTICYPSLFKDPDYIHQIFIVDLTISTLDNPSSNTNHIISSFSDLSVTLDFPSRNLRFFLVRGSPFLTCNVLSDVCLSITTVHAVLGLIPNRSCTKYRIKLNNNQTWLLYASSTIKLSHDTRRITSTLFSGVIRIAALPVSSPKSESTLDRFSSCYAVSGEAVFTKPFSLEYKWEKRGVGELLMLAHPLHLRLMSDSDCFISVLEDFKYDSIDGELVGVVGDSWALKTDPVSVTWHSIKGVEKESYPVIIQALDNDVDALDASSVFTSSSYLFGEWVASAARLALIAEEVCYSDVIPAIKRFLKEMMEPWLEGTFALNGFLYDAKWGGIVTEQGLLHSAEECGFAKYNNHHYHLGYFVYGIAVLAKIDPAWGIKYRAQAYSLMADYMNLSRRESSHYTRLRCFDLWKLHSWAGEGLNASEDGRNQQSTSEAVNAYYAAALMGLAYGDSHLVTIASTITAFEILAAQTWWHVKEENSLYPSEFSKDNRVVGVLWANKRENGVWFGAAQWKEYRLGIQMLPILPITEALFSDVGFVKQLVDWTLPALATEGVEEAYKVFSYALQGVYDKEGALRNVSALNGYDDGIFLSNLLWWIHSRDDQSQGREAFSWFRHYFR